MLKYLLKRLSLIPLTLFAIISINFVILNVAPGDMVEECGNLGEAERLAKGRAYKGPDRYLQFRERYGLTLPIFFNLWPKISHAKVRTGIQELLEGKSVRGKSLSELRVYWGDRARFVMPILLFEASEFSRSDTYRHVAADLFIRGGIRQGIVGSKISDEQRENNQHIAASNAMLINLLQEPDIQTKVDQLKIWFQQEGGIEAFSYPFSRGWKTFLFETRFCKYLSRMMRLDFGTLRNDPNKTVISEVTKRLGSSLILSLLPMVVVFVLCQLFGMLMALYRGRWIDHILNFMFLILFSIPVFVAVPWIIDTFALNKTIPFTNIPMPYSGLSSSPEVFAELSSWGRFMDIIAHAVLPFLSVSYTAFAAQARLSRSVFLEILGQDYIRAAQVRGICRWSILTCHVGKNASTALITSLTSSIGSLLGGALVVETLFNIDGFGLFFYNAVLNRDHNVVLFSVIMGAVLSLVGYLLGDLLCVLLDPRIRLEGREV